MTVLIVILILLAVVLALAGIVGAIVPAVPGPPLSFLSLLAAHFAFPEQVSWTVLLVMLLATVVVSILDYVAPIWLTKLGGGSKKAMWGSTIGIIIGLFFMPVGLIVGPIVGAFIGEMMHQDRVDQAIKVAAMSFISFLLTTGLKLVVCLMMTYYVLAAFWHETAALLSFA